LIQECVRIRVIITAIEKQ